MLRFLLPPLLLCTPLALAQELPAGAFARLGGTALRHPERPLALAFRAGTAELASLGSDGTVRIWDTKTGKELQVLRKKDSQANGMALSANGAFLAVHFGENQIRIYDTAKKYEQVSFAAVKMLEGMSISDDGKLVAGLHLGKPMIVEMATGLDRMELPEGTAVAVAPDGKSVAVAQKDKDDHLVEVFEVPSGKRMLRIVRPGTDKASINSVAYAPDSRTLAMASDGGAPIVLFALGKEEPLAKFEGSGPVAFANAETLIGRNGNKLTVWDTVGKFKTELARDVSTYSMGNDGKTAATDSGSLLGSPRIRLWDLEKEEETIFGKERLSGLIRIGTDAKSEIIATTREQDYSWNPATNKVEPQILCAPPVPRDPTYRCVVSKNSGVTIATSASEKPYLSFITPELAQQSKIELASSVLDLAVHPEGKSFAAITRDGFVRVWDAAGKELWKTRLARSLRAGIAYSPDGKSLVATSIIRVALFDSADGKELGMINRQWEDGPFTSVCFNHDGSLIAAGTQGSAGSGNVYEAASLGLVKRCEGNCGSVIGVAFAAKSDVLVTGHSDDSLLAWKLIEPPAKPTTLEKLWSLLLEEDAAVAWPAMMALVDAKEKAVAAIAGDFKTETTKPAELLRKQRAAVVLKRIGSAEAKALLVEMNK